MFAPQPLCFRSVDRPGHSPVLADQDRAFPDEPGERVLLCRTCGQPVARVRDRVRKGGHDVPADKIRSRYQRSQDLLLPAMRTCNRAFVFDNSGADLVFVAELREGVLTLRTEAIPIWFDRHVLSRL